MKKSLLVIVAVLLVVIALAGCAGNEKNNDGANQGATDNQKVKEEVTPQATPEPPLKFSMSFKGFDNPYIDRAGNLNNDKYVLEINKLAHVELDLKVKSHKNYEQQMQLMFASGDIPDLVWADGDPTVSSIKDAVNSGVFLDLDDLLEKHKAELPNLMSKIPAQAWEQVKVDGKTVGIPVSYLSTGLNGAMYIRKDLLDKYQLSVPTTLDEAVNVLKVFQQNGMKYPIPVVRSGDIHKRSSTRSV